MNDALLAAKLGLNMGKQKKAAPVAKAMPKGKAGGAPSGTHDHANAFQKAHAAGDSKGARRAALDYAKSSRKDEC